MASFSAASTRDSWLRRVLQACGADAPPPSPMRPWTSTRTAPNGMDAVGQRFGASFFRTRRKLGQEWFVNKVGTCGMANAQLYWGRMALLLRLLYSLFPSIGWQFVFVDDFLWLLRVGESGFWGPLFFSPCLL